MRELYADSKSIAGEDGVPRQFSYYILIDEMDINRRFACESYGIKVSERGGDSTSIPDITVDIKRIDELLNLLVRNAVGPASLSDVVADWL